MADNPIVVDENAPVGDAADPKNQGADLNNCTRPLQGLLDGGGKAFGSAPTSGQVQEEQSGSVQATHSPVNDSVTVMPLSNNCTDGDPTTNTLFSHRPTPDHNGTDTDEWEVDVVMDSRVRRDRKGVFFLEYKVGWRGYAPSWEPERNVIPWCEELVQPAAEEANSCCSCPADEEGGAEVQHPPNTAKMICI
ncbi:hypothetical protein ACJ73_09548 [Blastomyces percursus]|uniref:Chromo domain-containing protein n=1 Tax=Blastomyces percursus TaxID=1658174 RepID=A0A1J9P5H0_9EURO|nr:hypothetical protein ACJ73_09548 [Blastomyces percursus]